MRKQWVVLCCMVGVSLVLSAGALQYRTGELFPASAGPVKTKPQPTARPTPKRVLKKGEKMAGPLFRQESNAAVSGSTVTVNKPTGTVNGDIMIASIIKTNAAAVTPPSGWTLLKKQLAASGPLEIHTYWKLAASEGANYAWGVGSSSDAYVAIDSYSSADGSIPTIYDGAAPGSTSTPTAPSVTSIYNDSLLICVIAVASSHGPGGPTGMTTRSSTFGLSNCMTVNDLALPTAGATGAKACASGFTQQAATQSIVIAPFGAVPPVKKGSFFHAFK